MSRPKYYWYSIAKRMIRRYDRLGKSRQERIWKKAIDETLEKMGESENGDYKVGAVRLVLFEGCGYGSTAEVMHYSERTIRRWCEEFINKAGRKAGY